MGDDKQSIYLFRGANVSIFRQAGKKLEQWIGDEYNYVEVKENYRSLSAVTDFANALFERLMTAETPLEWMTRYELSQAVPPAYTEYIGKQLMQAIKK